MPARNKLPRSLSLKRRVDIDLLFSKGRRFPGHSFTLLWRPAEEFRFGIFVPTEYGKAHERNRIKRVFREAVRLCRRHLQVPGWIGIVPRREAAALSTEAIRVDVCRIFTSLTAEKS